MTDRAFDSVPEWAKGQATVARAEKRPLPTDEQLEPIARRYCELMGQDPDQIVRLYHDDAPFGPHWKSALPIVRQQAALSIAFGGK